MNKELKYLIDILREAQLKAEAAELMHLLIKSAEIYDVNLQSWQAVITELDKPYDTQIQGKAILYIAEAIKNLADAEPLKQFNKLQIEESAATIKRVMANSSVSPDDFFVKRAGVMSLLGKAAPLFSFIIAAKNIYYGFNEFKKIQSSASEIGLNWMDTMQPDKMLRKAEELKDSPKELLVLTRLIRSAKLLYDEGISFLVNMVDGFKDIFFVFANLATGGISSIIDFSISMMLWLAVESPSEDYIKSKYDVSLNLIRSISNMAIATILEQKAPQPNDQIELQLPYKENFNANEWWASD